MVPVEAGLRSASAKGWALRAEPSGVLGEECSGEVLVSANEWAGDPAALACWLEAVELQAATLGGGKRARRKGEKGIGREAKA